MKSQKIIFILIFSIIGLSLNRCKTEEIILHGEISGIVTDTLNSQPIQGVAVKLNPINDTTSTSSNGKYLFKSLIPGDYKIEVSKPPYSNNLRSADVSPANTTEINFALHKISYPEISDTHLDFGFDSTQLSFNIANTGTGELNYSITSSQDWITVNPNIGEITTEPQTINVTINRTGLSEKKHVEWVEVVFHVGRDLVQDTIHVFLNGVMDQDYNYYNIVTIGTQTWMAENLNVGQMISNGPVKPADNEKIEKYCYDDNKTNCNIYGGLYTWHEMMQYKPSDEGIIGTTQGVCPVGWHIPTYQEWTTMIDYLGGVSIAGGKLKEIGLAHWLSPNTGATNETGFSALPGGALWYRTDPANLEYLVKGTHGLYGTAKSSIDSGIEFNTFTILKYDQASAMKESGDLIDTASTSVRCIKDPPKKR